MKIRIQKFKQLEDIEIELGSITLLVGGNNAGKSSILQSIQFGVSIAQVTTLQEKLGGRTIVCQLLLVKMS